jgi:hypothetical protein
MPPPSLCFELFGRTCSGGWTYTLESFLILPSSPFAVLSYVTQGNERIYEKVAVRARVYVGAGQVNVFLKKTFM